MPVDILQLRKRVENSSGKQHGLRRLHTIRNWMWGIISQRSISYLSKGRKVNLMHLDLHPDRIYQSPDPYFVSALFSVFKHDLRIKNCPFFHLHVRTYSSIFVVPESHLSSILQQTTLAFFWGGGKEIQSKYGRVFNLSTSNLESPTVICKILYTAKDSSLHS